jgi:hypothetical protein
MAQMKRDTMRRIREAIERRTLVQPFRPADSLESKFLQEIDPSLGYLPRSTNSVLIEFKNGRDGQI